VSAWFNLLVDGRAARYARNIATAMLTELIPLVRAHATEGGGGREQHQGPQWRKSNCQLPGDISGL